jgi:hypothetical protein
MSRLRTNAWLLMGALLLALTPAVWAAAPPLTGRVVTGAQPVAVPGASVEVSEGSVKKTVVTGDDGTFSLPDLAAGAWTLRVTMTGFKTATQTVAVPAAQPVEIALTIGDNSAVPELKTRPLAPAAPGAGTTTVGAVAVNGSVDNGAASVYAQSPAFGNARPQGRGLYNGGLEFTLGNSALDARSYSLTGANTPRPSYNDLTGSFNFGGPLVIPHVTSLYSAPRFYVQYEKQLDRNAVTTAALVPTLAERGGDLSAVGGPVIAPSELSPQAQALVGLYPLPNITGNGQFNYQAPVASIRHQDSLQARLSQNFAGRNFVSGTFNLQSARADGGSIFGFTDRTGTLGINSAINWNHSFGRSVQATFALNYSRNRTRLTPFFAGREDVAGEAGILGGSTDAADWGPPTLNFTSGWAALRDGVPENNRNQTVAFTTSLFWYHMDHNVNMGGGVSWLQFNQFQQSNPRGAFTFTGAGSGNDLADFLLGNPDTVSLDVGAADRYLRQTSDYLFVSDDWRASDGLSLTLGFRWEYQAPITETQNRLVNLQVSPDFSAITPMVTGAPLRPDRHELEPRLGLAWEPFAASSVIVRAGYGVYFDTSVYPALANALTRQPPLDRSFSVASTAAAPLTLATALQTPAPAASASATSAQIGIDPNFRIGYVQTWSASIQRDLPGSLVGTVGYMGNRGGNGVQRFLPNSYAPGGVNPCPLCPSGFVYETTGGHSNYEAGQATLQRRFHNGVAATVTYTYAHAMDDAAVGGGGGNGGASPVFLAQNWRDLGAEWARSSFDQRHKVSVTAQYSTGSRLFGGSWTRGWTLTTQITVGSGMPLTPSLPLVIGGTGRVGIRPDRTGAPLYAVSGRNVNPAAFTAPAAGSWGDAGRDSITGPRLFGMDASMQRTFPVHKNLTALFRLDATNVLNHVNFPSWDTTVGSAQFGLPLTANPMRTVRATIRLNF